MRSFTSSQRSPSRSISWRGGPDRRPDARNDSAWQKAMAAAFASPKFDDYLDRLHDVDRSVVTRYRFNDPRVVLSGEETNLPALAYSDSERFAKSVLLSGEKLEAQSDPRGAAGKYWSVARFGQMMDAQGRTGRERWIGTSLQALAYKQLQSLSEKRSDGSGAALFKYLAAKFDPAERERALLQEEGFFGHYTARRNAVVLQISSLAMLFFAGLAAIALVSFISSRGSRETGRQRVRQVATVLSLTSSVGLLLSCATIYLTYRPYWYIFQHVLLTGDMSQTTDLREFLISTETLPVLGERVALNLPSTSGRL